MDVVKILFDNKDLKYKKFNSSLIPNINPDLIIGVKVPILRKIVSSLTNDEKMDFINSLPHKYYEENMIHAIILSNIKDYDYLIEKLDYFMPYIDNWAICDCLTPKIFKKNKDKLIIKINEWIKIDKTYYIRFAVKMLMNFYLDDKNIKPYLDTIIKINKDDYYVNMMRAWFFQVALLKNWDVTIKYIENYSLDTWTHNKAISKSIESFRFTKEEKDYLRKLKRK